MSGPSEVDRFREALAKWLGWTFAEGDSSHLRALLDRRAADHKLSRGDYLNRLQARPCLAVLCGGSEVAQQAAMAGAPRALWDGALFAERLAGHARRLRPDVPYVAATPSGGALPFHAGTGVSHYYGVGAYRRPLEDARRAGVRFAAECLAFSHVPSPAAVDALMGGRGAPGSHPRGTRRSRCACWDTCGCSCGARGRGRCTRAGCSSPRWD